MHKYILLFSFALSAVSTPCAIAEDKPTPKEEVKAQIVKMEMLPSRHFLVKVKLDGKGPYNLILDTGAPLTIISSKAAKDAGIVKKGDSGGGLGALFGGLNQVTVGKLQVGDVLAEKTPAVVMDHPTVQAISEAFEKDHGVIDGIVGFPFFAKFAMTVDYKKAELTLKPNGYKPGDYMQDMMKSLMNPTDRNEPRSVVPAALWGLVVDKEKDDEKAGVVIKKVFEKSAADLAGFKTGDRLLTIDGRWTDTVGDTFIATGLVKPNKTVVAVVQRDGKEVKLNVTPTAGR